MAFWGKKCILTVLFKIRECKMRSQYPVRDQEISPYFWAWANHVTKSQFISWSNENMINYLGFLEENTTTNMRLNRLQRHWELTKRPLFSSDPGNTVWSSHASFFLGQQPVSSASSTVKKMVHLGGLSELCLRFSLFFSICIKDKDIRFYNIW